MIVENMNPEPSDKVKYKNLRGAVGSYTEGFTSIMWPGFSHLASYALRNLIPVFDVDFLSRTILPRPDSTVGDGFFEYRDLPAWFESTGCSIRHVARFQMHVRFGLGTETLHRYERTSEMYMRFSVHTELQDDRSKVYSYDYESGVWFDHT